MNKLVLILFFSIVLFGSVHAVIQREVLFDDFSDLETTSNPAWGGDYNATEGYLSVFEGGEEWFDYGTLYPDADYVFKFKMRIIDYTGNSCVGGVGYATTYWGTFGASQYCEGYYIGGEPGSDSCNIMDLSNIPDGCGNRTSLIPTGFNLDQWYDIRVEHFSSGDIYYYVDDVLVGSTFDLTRRFGNNALNYGDNSFGVYAGTNAIVDIDDVNVTEFRPEPYEQGFLNYNFTKTFFYENFNGATTFVPTDVGAGSGSYYLGNDKFEIASLDADDFATFVSTISEPTPQKVPIAFGAKFMPYEMWSEMMIGITENPNGSFQESVGLNQAGYWLYISSYPESVQDWQICLFYTVNNEVVTCADIPQGEIGEGVEYDVVAQRDSGYVWRIFLNGVEYGTPTFDNRLNHFPYMGIEYYNFYNLQGGNNFGGAFDNIFFRGQGYYPAYSSSDLPNIVTSGIGGMFVAVTNNLSALIGLLVIGLIVVFMRNDLFGGLKR